MINTALQSSFTDSKTVNKATITVRVEMKPSKLVETLSVEVLKEMQRLVPSTQFKDVDDLCSEDISRYLKTLIWMRVQQCADDFTPAYKAYFRIRKLVSVPVMAYQLLIPIGVATDRDFSIRFEPEYSITESELLSPDEMRAISDVMSRLESNGFKMEIGIPQSPEGELDFMALCHVEDVVLGYRKSHPVYGFLASFFVQKKLNEITGSMCRVIYGYDSDYEVYIRQIFRKLNS